MLRKVYKELIEAFEEEGIEITDVKRFEVDTKWGRTYKYEIYGRYENKTFIRREKAILGWEMHILKSVMKMLDIN